MFLHKPIIIKLKYSVKIHQWADKFWGLRWWWWWSKIQAECIIACQILVPSQSWSRRAPLGSVFLTLSIWKCWILRSLFFLVGFVACSWVQRVFPWWRSWLSPLPNYWLLNLSTGRWVLRNWGKQYICSAIQQMRGRFSRELNGGNCYWVLRNFHVFQIPLMADIPRFVRTYYTRLLTLEIVLQFHPLTFFSQYGSWNQNLLMGGCTMLTIFGL